MNVPVGKYLDQSIRNPLCRPTVCHQFTEHRPATEDDDQKTERRTDSILDRRRQGRYVWVLGKDGNPQSYAQAQ